MQFLSSLNNLLAAVFIPLLLALLLTDASAAVSRAPLSWRHPAPHRTAPAGVGMPIGIRESEYTSGLRRRKG